MSKINILKSKLNGKRAGEFSLTDANHINLKVGLQHRPELERKLLELLSKYFNIVTLNQKSNKKGRGSVGKSIRYEKKKNAHN